MVIVCNTEDTGYSRYEGKHLHYTDNLVTIPVGSISVAVGYTVKGEVPDKSLFTCASHLVSCDYAARFYKCNLLESPPVPIVFYKYFTASNIMNLQKDYAEVLFFWLNVIISIVPIPMSMQCLCITPGASLSVMTTNAPMVANARECWTEWLAVWELTWLLC